MKDRLNWLGWINILWFAILVGLFTGELIDNVAWWGPAVLVICMLLMIPFLYGGLFNERYFFGKL
jgi:hypothetical protein